MATITARFPGTCCVCGKAVSPGQAIEYTKGAPVRHAACKAPEVPADAVRLSGGEGYGCEGWTPGEVVANRKRYDGSTRAKHRKEADAASVAALRGVPYPEVPRVPQKMQYVFRDGKGVHEENPSYDTEVATYQAAKERYEADKAAYEETKKRALAAWPDDDGPEYLFVLTASSRYYRDDGMSFGVGDERGYVYEAVCRPATEEESRPLREQAERRRARSAAHGELKRIADEIREKGR